MQHAAAQRRIPLGEYITQHEIGYEVGENMPDFVDYSKLGEFIMQEREGEFMGGCFVCMEESSYYTQIMGEKPHTMEMEGI